MNTKQLDFWKGSFGDSYLERNSLTPQGIEARGDHLDRVFLSSGVGRNVSILEIGANVGHNLKGLRRKGWGGFFYAVEPNKRAYDILISDEEIALTRALNCDGFRLPFEDNSIDIVFTCGVLIHVHPDDLLKFCSEIYRVSGGHIVCMEYFSPEPEEILYRGHQGFLFKRDFGSFYLDHWSRLRLVDYGFLWKRVSNFDNVTWWIFEKAWA